ncbi:MAG: DUF2431 domain-containing protein [Verrucomicrobia bacterium]|nr:DUF2431 domain-containing protein [Verrucomicrobiota bacterium]
MAAIGFHASPQSKITFLESAGQITAHLGENQKTVPVALPEINYPPHCLSTVDKVQFLLHNFHFLPTLTPAQGGTKAEEISFTPLNPEDKTWEKQAELTIPSEDVKWVALANGSIVYASYNTLTIWNWNENTFKTIACSLRRITSLAEMKGGELLAGDEKGFLCIPGQEPFDSGLKASISEIVPLNASFCLIKTETETCVFSFKDKKIVERLGNPQKTLALENGDILALESDQVFRWTLSSEKYTKTSTKFTGIQTMQRAQGMSVILALNHKEGEKKQITLWDLEKNVSQEFISAQLWNKTISDQLILIGKDRFAIPLGTAIHFYEKTEVQSQPAAGNWGITCHLLLSDGSVMFATDTRGSGLHVATWDGKITFTSTELLQNQQVRLLVEFSSGSVLVKFPQSFMIICPKIKEAKSAKAEIERVQLELKLNPTKLKLYHTLAQKQEDIELKYITYLAGLEAAMKSRDTYQARRFYKKARDLKPDSEEPTQIYLSYQEKGTKEYARVSYELERIHKNISSRASSVLKKRLFIGEGDFSYTVALIEKHQAKYPQLPKFITATEFLEPVNEEMVLKRVEDLKAKGVTVLFGTDGQEIHRTFQGKRFERIHWNCPFPFARQREGMEKVMPRFFESASKLQLTGDRIHVTLMQGTSDNYWKTRQRENPILEGATYAGYRLIRKRLFGGQRYPGYVHVMTGRKEKYSAGGVEREFVFEKTTPPNIMPPTFREQAEALKDPQVKNYQINTDAVKDAKPGDYYIECSSDEDSSGYETD